MLYFLMRNIIIVLLLVLVVTLASCLPPPDDGFDDPVDPEPFCGNNILEAGEECDDGELNGIECSPSVGGTCTYCSNDCRIITLTGPSPPPPEPPIVDDFNLFVDKDSVNGQCSDSYSRTENSLSSPWCSIQRAADLSEPGDNIRIERGLYREYITISKSGTINQPITFSGVRESNGEWLTILDPSIITSGWVRATEVDPNNTGIYKANLGFDPYQITSNGKRFGGKLRVGVADGAWTGWGTRIYEILAFPTDYITPHGYGAGSYFWDGIEAMYTYDNGYTYVRFRNGENPNEMNVKAAPRGASIMIRDMSNIIISDLAIKGAQIGVRIEGANAKNNIIENNHMPHGMMRVTIGVDANDNHIRNNLIESIKLSDIQPGAWIRCRSTSYGSTDEGSMNCSNRAKLYTTHKNLFKYGHGFRSSGTNAILSAGEESEDSGISLSSEDPAARGPGTNNKIYNNTFRNLLVAIAIGYQSGSPTGGSVEIYNNIIENTSAQAIMLHPESHAKIYNNKFINTNMAIRLQNTGRGLERTLYFYNNEVVGHGPGRLAFFHVGTCTNTINQDNVFWFYHNSISHISESFSSTCNTNDHDAYPNMFIINNVDSSYHGSSLHKNIGSYSYNWYRLNGRMPTNMLSNIDGNREWIWSIGDSSLILPLDSPARNAGLDLSKSFTLHSRTHEPLPGMNAGYFSGSAPNMGAVQD